MSFGMPSPDARDRKELLKDKANNVANFINMSMQQLLQFIKDAKEKQKERTKALKTLLAMILSGFKSLCGKGISAGDAAKISALGNGMDSAGDAAKGDSAGAAAKGSAK